MAYLILAEKPSVARDLAQSLVVTAKRNGYWFNQQVTITWAVGHLLALVPPDVYDASWKQWREDTLPMIPKNFRLQVSQHAEDQWQVVQRLLQDTRFEYVVNACDAGREGELIFRWLYLFSKSKLTVKRLWLTSLTPASIEKGLRQLLPGQRFDNLYHAARCRSQADWLIGLNATRALTLQRRQQGSQALYSVGRVQTPTLALLVKRELEIEQFVAKTYWQIKILLRLPSTAQIPEQQLQHHFGSEVVAKKPLPIGLFEGIYEKPPQNRLERLEEAEAITQFLRQAIAQQGNQLLVEVVAVKQSVERRLAPNFFHLTSLQKAANQAFAFSAQKTLDIAQQLYEKHKLITYPRSDESRLTKDWLPLLPDILRQLEKIGYKSHIDTILGQPTLPNTQRLLVSDTTSDHHGIIPTEKELAFEDLSRFLDKDEEKLYRLIARRFIAAFMADAVYAFCRIHTQVSDYRFVSFGKSRLEEGFEALLPPAGNLPAATLPVVKQGDRLYLDAVYSKSQKTQPPPRYSDGLLLSAMEKAQGLEETEKHQRIGLGTPSTRAAIIEVLCKRGYVQREGRCLQATSQGKELIASVSMALLKSPELTYLWEEKLKAVSEGLLSYEAFMTSVFQLTHQVVGQLQQRKIKCPKCHHGFLLAGHRAWGCERFRQGCDYRRAYLLAPTLSSSASMKKFLERSSLLEEKTLLKKAPHG